MSTANLREAKPLTMMIIHGAFILAVFIYFIVTQMVLVPQYARPGAPSPMIGPISPFALFLILSLFQIPMGFLVGNFMRPAAPQPGDSPETFLAKKQMLMIVSDAFFESIAIYGLVAIIMGAQPWQGYSLMALSLLLLLIATWRVVRWLEEFHELARRR